MTRNQKRRSPAPTRSSPGRWPRSGRGDFIIDGEIIAFDGSQTKFARLQQRLGVINPGADLLAQVPVSTTSFDVLCADGRDVRPLALRERKEILHDLLSFDGPLRFTEHGDTDGEAYYREACASGWEGLIAKRADAPYRGGPEPGLAEVQMRERPGVRYRRLHRPAAGPAPGSARCCSATTTPATSSSTRARSAPASPTNAAQPARAWPAWSGPSPVRRGQLPRSGVHWVQPRLVAQVGSANGPPPESCATRGSRACGTTRTPPMSSGRCRKTTPGKDATVHVDPDDRHRVSP